MCSVLQKWFVLGSCLRKVPFLLRENVLGKVTLESTVPSPSFAYWLGPSICNIPDIQIKTLILMLPCFVLSVVLNINMIHTHANQMHVCAALADNAVGLCVTLVKYVSLFYQNKCHKRTLCGDPLTCLDRFFRLTDCSCNSFPPSLSNNLICLLV